MKLLVSGCTRTVAELASRYTNLGILLTPADGNSMAAVKTTNLVFGVDNGAYSGFDIPAFRRLLQKVQGQENLRWIVCPDKVADAKETLQLFNYWREEVSQAGPVAFVGQDGQEDMAIPWDRFDCFFVGGSTAWKLSFAAAGLVVEAKRLGKWVHMGRVNTLRRLQYACDLGCDSVDGSSYSRWGDWHIERALRWMRHLERQPLLYQ